jgi:beta-galactosidase
MLSGQGVDRELHVKPDDLELIGDGIDATRVVLRVTDEYGGARPFANAAITMTIDGPGEIIGDNPFSLFGGVGAVWIKTKQDAGTIRLNARHPFLGTKTVEIMVKSTPPGVV